MTASADQTNTDNNEFWVGTPNAADLTRHSVRGSLATILSQGAKLVIQLGSQMILARLLFPAEFGLVAMAYPIIAFLQVFNDIGLGQAIVQRSNLARDQASALFWITIIISSALSIIVALLAPLAAWIYGEPRLIPLTIVLGLIFPVTAAGVVPNAIMARHMQFGKMARNEVIAVFTGAVVTVGCAWFGLSYWSLLVGQFANTIVAVFLVWVTISWWPAKPKLVGSTWQDIKFGANITFSNLATFATTSGDNMIVGLTAGKVPLGLYDRSYNLVVRPIGQMMTPLSRIALPLLSRLVDKPDEYRAAYLHIFRISTILIVPAMLVCISNGSTLIAVFLGPRWGGAGPIFSWLCVGGLTSGIYASTFWLFISQDRAQELRWYAALGAVVNVLSYLVGAIWGVVGIAMAASIGFIFVSTPLLFYAATRKGPVRPMDIVGCTIPFILQAAFVYAILALGFDKIPITGLPRIVAVTITSYVFFLTFSLIVPENRHLFHAVGRALKGHFPSTAN